MSVARKILFVEDDSDDRDMIAEVARDASGDVDIVFAENGVEAIQYLEEEKTKNSRMPCLIVLDLNMPLMDGRQTFQKIKNELRLESIPVIIFSSSRSPHDLEHFTKMNIEFISKPDNVNYLKNIVDHMFSVCCRA